MPRLERYINRNLDISCTYDDSVHGFFVEGDCSTDPYLEDKLSKYGRSCGLTRKGELWFIPQLYFKAVLGIAKHLRMPSIMEGITQFNTCLNRKIPQETRWVTPTDTELREYQQLAVRYLMSGSLLLGDDMGLGKTLAALWAWWLLRKDTGGNLLIFVPNDDVAEEWVQCYSAHLGQKTGALVIKDRRDIHCSAPVTIIAYTKIHLADYTDYLRTKCIRDKNLILVLDEGHKVSNINTKQHRASFEYARLCERVWLLSGSEVRNPDEYYGLYKMVKRLPPESRVTFDMWSKHYRNRGGRSWDKDRLKELNILRRSFALRRTKAEVCKDLPPLTTIRMPVPMNPVQQSLYRQMEKEKECEIVGQYGNVELSEKHFLTVYLRLMQLASHPLLLGETRILQSPKVDAVMNLIEGAGDQKVIVWSHWPAVIDYLAAEVSSRFPDLTCAKAHGGVSKNDRADAKSRLQARGLDVMIANPKVWGEGVNLQAASIMIYFDYHPSSTLWDQGRSRSHRIGQTLPITLYLPYHPNSIETRILAWLEEKRSLSTIITGG